ncbi:hypothetical protein [Pseudomonas sichuanensis]|uniref:hypothetical protein n=1 Tax=Pseudomonas TaxID=286 RepID=UPI0036E5BB17
MLDYHEMLAFERDDLHREIVRDQGKKLVHTQRWNEMGRPQEQWPGSDGKQSTLFKREYHYGVFDQLTDVHDTRRRRFDYTRYTSS